MKAGYAMSIERDHRLAVRQLKRLFGRPMIFHLEPETISDVVTGRRETVSIEVTIKNGMWCDASIAATLRLSGTPETGIVKCLKRIILDRNDLPREYLGQLLDETNANIKVEVDNRLYHISKIVPHSSGQIIEYYVEGE